MSWICNNKNDQSGRLDQAMRFISIVDGTIQKRYPTSSKHYLAQEYGVPLKAVSRIISDTITDQDVSGDLQLEHGVTIIRTFFTYIHCIQKLSLHSVREEMERVCKDIGVEPIDITTCQ